METVMDKKCVSCLKIRSADCFYRHPLTLDGRSGKCKECCKTDAKKRRRLHPEIFKERERNRTIMPLRAKHLRSNAHKWREKNPEKYKAQNAVNNAVRDGKLQKEPCLFCRSSDHVHAHHKDYSMPLDVIWLCPRCHHRMHANFGHEHGATV